MLSRICLVFFLVLTGISADASEPSTWNTTEINKDPWVLIDSGRYGEPAIQATSVGIGHAAIEVATMSIDCHSGEMIPNIRYSFAANKGLNHLDWWQEVSESIVVEVGSMDFDFSRTTYNVGYHPYMISDDDKIHKFFSALSKANGDITIKVKVPDNGQVRKLNLSIKNYRQLYNSLSARCSE
ncbi:hypothetical protein TspCOW1_11610 [Thiohalobacter sp. COW1]|uniref:hypothetical protein n=1 Tax=Thiohalobacter sp. COW1 TaxID=2795687 RepID=UPI0019158DBF|nr:hypothetical protein [Thiohalobacter sp. COW1]BCO31058.1 hypothetical protein TspCOW1_11610 [Thiohalobacter sp. COW1]